MLRKLLFWVIVLAGAHTAWNTPEIKQEIQSFFDNTIDDSMAAAKAASPKTLSISPKQIKSNLLNGLSDIKDVERYYIEEVAQSKQSTLAFQKEWCGNSYLHPVLNDIKKESVCKQISKMQTLLELK